MLSMDRQWKINEQGSLENRWNYNVNFDWQWRLLYQTAMCILRFQEIIFLSKELLCTRSTSTLVSTSPSFANTKSLVTPLKFSLPKHLYTISLMSQSSYVNSSSVFGWPFKYRSTWLRIFNLNTDLNPKRPLSTSY